MMNKIFLALGVFAAIVASGSALKCNRCSYDPKVTPHADNLCSPNATVDCPGGQYCFTVTYTHEDGEVGFLRNCGGTLVDNCPNITKGCATYSALHNLATCIGKCCQGDNCNNYSPGNVTVPPRPTSNGTEAGKSNGSLICNRCSYDPKAGPHADQKCRSNATVSCPAGKYCYTTRYTHKDGNVGFLRDCGGGAVDRCPNITKGCEAYSKLHDLATCVGECCEGDNCNNYTPVDPTPSTQAVTRSRACAVVAKISILVMVIVKIIFA
ncbi:uncharacterized protein LOC114519957 [Dendronephthya gigantea]|uniref:uncharacterized protein LOC114519957 n=1 Tax=Dendronephthya gigantea TaxID=151771 RepID=UPI00106C12A9|nr:uncharacterized protein LOC114519957 [Dendronephthya gigantea]XP_028395949.1 uncharacterized protein LOC114519957 [Dendronephthya gigantea]